MASTRNKNTLGDYELEQKSLNEHVGYFLYENAYNGSAYQTNLPGNGLLAGRMANKELSNNACDIESFLYGIGSTNLAKPQNSHNPVPDIKHIPSLNIIDKQTTFLPDPLVIVPNQRALRH